MDPDSLEDSNRKRKCAVTQQSPSSKRRSPDTGTMPSCIEEEAEAEVHSEDHVSTSHAKCSSDTSFPDDKLITMPPLTLEGDTLGQKRQHYNKLVEDAVANKHYELRNISSDDSDIDNLLKIDIASKNRNVDYIIEVMKSNDMLYAATAIKKSTWLITDPQYANIINPEYLHAQLLPNMNTKTFNKLMLHIRLNLKDESRVEAFYTYFHLKNKDETTSYKWLEKCSIPFIDDALTNFVPLSVFERLCRRSGHFIAYYENIFDDDVCVVTKEILFLFKSRTADFLNLIEQCSSLTPKLGKKKTDIFMKKYANKIFNDFDKYIFALDLSVVAKYLNKKEIKPFLRKQGKEFAGYLFQFHNLRHFIKQMPEKERFGFVKKTFIDKTELAAFYPKYEESKINQDIKTHQWYEFAPFNEALIELTKLIRKENSPSERCAMLSILITCARRNLQHIKTLLTFFNEIYIHELFKFKIQFVNNLLSDISTHEFDVETWNVLNQLFHSMDVYTESENDVQICLQSIVLYKVLHDEFVPEIVELKLKFNTFEKVQSKLNREQRSKMFTYLFDSVLTKLQIKNFPNESDFSKTIDQLENVLTLLRDWKKDISKYPIVLEKIKELNQMKQEHMWKTDMSCLYNMKKSWRKHMFEESLSLCLSEEACLNALKHKPQLLTRHDKEIDTLRTNDAVSLRRLLTKLRVYWPHSLAQHWTDAYLRNLNKPTGKKAVIQGLFALLQQNQVIEMAKKYKPDNIKVNRGKTGQNEISIRQNIARQLHVARPLIPLDTVLWYADGDYLKHALPSLSVIWTKLSVTESREYLPKLLDASVSLQTFGLNLAVYKFTLEDLKIIISKVWKTTKHPTIRSVLFGLTFDQMRDTDNLTDQKELWEMLSTFIDSLTAEESEEIYKKIDNFQNVPVSIRSEFYMKSYKFLTSLPASANCENYVKNLIELAPNLMEILDEDFAVNKMLSPAETKFCSYGSEVLEVFACYVLCGKSEKDQLQRFRRVIEPAIDEALQLWNSTRSGHYYIRDNFNKFLSSLGQNLWKIEILPVKLFIEIKTKMEKGLSLLENYVLFTSWKLVTEYVTVMDEHKSILSKDKFLQSKNNYINNIHNKIAPSLGPIIVKCLKGDTEQYNTPTIHCLFTKAFQKMFQVLSLQDELCILETLEHMLNDYDFIPSFLVVTKMIPNADVDECEIQSKIHRKIQSHPSKAVQMHYFDSFPNHVQ